MFLLSASMGPSGADTSRVRRPSRPKPQPNQLVRADEVAWKPLDEPGITGIYVKVLRHDEAANRAPTILLRFEPGARYPGHVHPGGEEIFVLEGDLRVGKDRLRAGDYLHTAPDNAHAVYSEGGCVVLLSVPEAVRLLRRGD